MSCVARVGVSFVIAALMGFGVALLAADAKPLTEKDLISLVELQIDDAAIAAKLQKGGLGFTADDAALTRLRQAGASEAVLKAVQAAAQAKPAAPPAGAITYQDVHKLLSLGVDEEAILKRLEKSPTLFVLEAAQVAELKQVGASPRLLDVMQKGRAITPAAAEMITDFAIILDSSGSMREKTTDGVMKMTAAKRVVTELVQKIPDGLNVTFVLYGHKVLGGPTDPRNCQVVEVVRPISPLNPEGKSQLATMIAGLQPTGATPIALSLRTAGAELAKNNAPCGLILITDGLETCQGDPIAEAAALVGKLKITFGVNVVGFGVKPEENQALKQIADAGKGKYYSADSSAELSDALQKMRQELEVVAQPAEKKGVERRAIIVHKPPIAEFPELGAIRLISRGLGSTSTDGQGGYEEEIRVPSSETKYDVVWIAKDKELGEVVMLRDQTFPERKLVELRPEELLGLVRVNGQGQPKGEIVVSRPGGLGSVDRATQCKRFGQVMVVPKGKWNVYIGGDKIEENLTIEPGKLHELE